MTTELAQTTNTFGKRGHAIDSPDKNDGAHKQVRTNVLLLDQPPLLHWLKPILAIQGIGP